MGYFSYSSKWIRNYSEKILKLNQNTSPPHLPEEAEKDFQELKKSLDDAMVGTMTEDNSFQVETNASNQCKAATLKQDGRATSSTLVSNSKCVGTASFPGKKKKEAQTPSNKPH